MVNIINRKVKKSGECINQLFVGNLEKDWRNYKLIQEFTFYLKKL